MIVITLWLNSDTSPTLIHTAPVFHNRRMENNKRLLTKALTWQLIGFVVMSLINYWMIGDWRQGMGLSGLLTAVGLVSYFLHERVWSRIGWGRS